MELRPSTGHLPAGVDLEGFGRGGSLPAVWSRRWAGVADSPVLFDATPGGAGRWMTADELEDRSRRAAERLGQLGAVPGDRVLWSCRPSAAALVVAVGVLRAGLVLVPFNPQATAREVAHVVSDVRPAVAVVDGADQRRWLLQAAVEPVAVTDPALTPAGGAVRRPGPRLPVAPALPGLDPAGPAVLDAPAPNAAALIGYTSGTTGAPKGAVLTHANLLAGTEALVAAWRWDASDRLVHTLPIFHAHGLCVGVFGTLLSGGSAVLLGRFDPVSVEEACRWHHASLFFGVPTMYHRLVDAPQGRVLGRLRLAVSGSAPLAADLHRRLSRQVGIDVLERYGMTETLMTVSNPVEGERRPGTVGFPLPGVEVRLAPAVAGGASSAPAVAGGASTQPRGAAQILVRGPGVFAGYWDRPVANAEAFSDGWFYTGDLGAVDDAGYLRILGRSTELIISGGFNVYPAEVEEVLAAHPAVAEVAVTGTPSDEWGEVVTAWVVPAVGSGDDALVADLVQHAATRLSAYKRPRLVRFVEELPRTALGKVQRGALA